MSLLPKFGSIRSKVVWLARTSRLTKLNGFTNKTQLKNIKNKKK